MLNQHKNASKSKVVQDVEHRDLVLVGGNAFKLLPRPPDVTDYKGPFYHHDNPVDMKPLHDPRELMNRLHMMNVADRIDTDPLTPSYTGNIAGKTEHHVKTFIPGICKIYF